MKKFSFSVLALVLLVITYFSTTSQAQTTVNLAQQCDCEVKKPGTEVTAGATTPAGTNTGDLLVDASGDIFYWDGDSWELPTAGGSTPWDNADGTPASQSSTDINYMGGKVGIGTQNPQNELHVSSPDRTGIIVQPTNTGFQSELALRTGLNSEGWYHQAFGATHPNTPYQNDWRLEYWNGTGGRTVLYADHLSGNIGIGTQSPLYPLSLKVNGGTGLEIINAASNDKSWRLKPVGNNLGIVQTGTNNYSGIYLKEVLGADGVLTANIGMGTQDPMNKLHINGAGRTSQSISTTDKTSMVDLALHVDHPTTNAGWVFTARGSNFSNVAGEERDLIATYWNGVNSNNLLWFGEHDTGNMGIGTNTPKEKLHVNGNIAVPFSFTLGNADQNTASDYILNNYYDTDYAGTGSAFDVLKIAPQGNSRSKLLFQTVEVNGNAPVSRMSISHDGNVGIGAVLPTAKLDVYGNGRFTGGDLACNQAIYTSSSAVGTWSSIIGVRRATGERGDIQFSPNNDLKFLNTHTLASTDVAFVFVASGGTPISFLKNGKIQSNGNTFLSDRRLKEDITSTDYGIGEVMKMEVVDYKWKKSGAQETGFIAQDMAKVLPYLVLEGGEDAEINPWSIDYAKITPILAKAIQEQQAQIDTQQKEIEALKAEKVALKAQVEKVKNLETQLNELKAMVEAAMNNNNSTQDAEE